MITSNPRDGETKMNPAPDVQLVGNNTVLDSWAREQPANPRTPFSVEIKLLPVNLDTMFAKLQMSFYFASLSLYSHNCIEHDLIIMVRLIFI